MNVGYLGLNPRPLEPVPHNERYPLLPCSRCKHLGHNGWDCPTSRSRAPKVDPDSPGSDAPSHRLWVPVPHAPSVPFPDAPNFLYDRDETGNTSPRNHFGTGFVEPLAPPHYSLSVPTGGDASGAQVAPME